MRKASHVLRLFTERRASVDVAMLAFRVTLAALDEKVAFAKLKDFDTKFGLGYVFGNQFNAFIEAGGRLVREILAEKEIPARSGKVFEMAGRVFMSIRAWPRDVYGWLDKNRRSFDLLLESESWPNKTAGGDLLFSVGPLTIHNTVGFTGADLASVKGAVGGMVRGIKGLDVPSDIERVLYGDVFIVARLSQGKTMAWYNPDEDRLYVRSAISTGEDDVRFGIHEFGHRYWRRMADTSRKRDWQRHHWDVEGGHGRHLHVEYPKVGDELPWLRFTGLGRNPPNPVVVAVIGTPGHGVGAKYVVEVAGKRGTIRDDSIIEMAMKRSKREAFPTPYSATDEEEHFCEALSLLATGQLREPHLSEFRRIWG